MKTNKIVFGVTLILLGILFLFANLNLISWDFVSGMWKLWPLVLVLWGLDLVITDNTLLKTILFLLLILLAFFVYFYKYEGKLAVLNSGGDNAGTPFYCSSRIYYG